MLERIACRLKTEEYLSFRVFMPDDLPTFSQAVTETFEVWIYFPTTLATMVRSV